ncbi:hypothetical protein EYF80_040953 [Liparis tanakae]|uniref:Uncharacterized protein n=1 Tax=Liparis tanakae TaxID=230148 RepID=A0A4Z2G5M4_9TELE|nr:hypothetical protein EYF80_040953 [Liparis tanakae]
MSAFTSSAIKGSSVAAGSNPGMASNIRRPRDADKPNPARLVQLSIRSQVEAGEPMPPSPVSR